MLNGYTPVFSNAPESIYEMELTRAAIHSFASFASKLKPEISGTAQKNLERTLQFKPNPFMDTSKFIYRIATILSVNNTCFIVPIEDEFGGLIGYYPLLPQRCEVVEYNGAPFLRYTFGSGQKAAIEFERVGVMTQFQYTDDFFGESNAALRPTMQLIHTQNQGIINGVKNSASITDQRLNTSLCGVVAAVVQQIDTAAFNAQLQAWFAEYQSLSAAEYNTLVSYMNSLKLQGNTQYEAFEQHMADFETQAAADFNAWFNGLQNVLDDNAATNLLNITNALDARVDMLEAVLFNDITTNPFLILFDDLDGVTSTGIWNESLQRIEC